MPDDAISTPAPPRLSRLWLAAYAIILVFTAVLVVETALRIPFPWDLYAWSESPFLTNMMKLDQHQPIYTTPADGNSFVYAPGLEYICYAVLKPLGLELDIRWDRLVSTLLGVFAAGFGALSAVRLARPVVGMARTKSFFVVTWGLVWLVLSKNFMADIDHPDNLHFLHATIIFWLCLVAVDTKRFGIALLSMFIAGFGLFTKQTEMISFLGLLAAYGIFNAWGWQRWFVLAAVGAGTLALSAGLLWHDPFARFWTFQLLTEHQKMWPTKLYPMFTDIFSMDRGPLVFLGIIAFPCLWSLGGALRRGLVCWVCVGFFAALPNVSAYLKTMGIYNDLIIMEIWLVILVWPFIGMLLERLPQLFSAREAGGVITWERRMLPLGVGALAFLFLVLLVPMKVPPRPGDMAFGRAIEDGVTADLKAGRKVLLTHSTAALIRAGVKEAPRDRANSVLELVAGDVGNLADIKTRINAHYYDRIYLVVGKWYHDDITNCIMQNYKVDYIIPRSPYTPRLIYGYGDLMLDDVPVLSPRETNAAAQTEEAPAQQTAPRGEHPSDLRNPR